MGGELVARHTRHSGYAVLGSLARTITMRDDTAGNRTVLHAVSLMFLFHCLAPPLALPVPLFFSPQRA